MHASARGAPGGPRPPRGRAGSGAPSRAASRPLRCARRAGASLPGRPVPGGGASRTRGSPDRATRGRSTPSPGGGTSGARAPPPPPPPSESARGEAPPTRPRRRRARSPWRRDYRRACCLFSAQCQEAGPGGCRAHLPGAGPGGVGALTLRGALLRKHRPFPEGARFLIPGSPPPRQQRPPRPHPHSRCRDPVLAAPP